MGCEATWTGLLVQVAILLVLTVALIIVARRTDV